MGQGGGVKALNCPRCGVVLMAREEESGLTWWCGGCGGLTVNFSQFRRRVSAWEANRIWEMARRGGRGRRRATACPECERVMTPVETGVSVAGGAGAMWICVSCQRLWMEVSVRGLGGGEAGRLGNG
jgi:ribosomal protein S27AE